MYEEFPTPLINRLEKHFVLYSSVLENWQTDTLRKMEEWIKDFSHVQSSNARYICTYICKRGEKSSMVCISYECGGCVAPKGGVSINRNTDLVWFIASC